MRKKKLSLDPETLAVDSFETGRPAGEARGTVRGHAPPCTWAQTCNCPSARYWCANDPATAYSCTYTFNEYCTMMPATQHTCVDA